MIRPQSKAVDNITEMSKTVNGTTYKTFCATLGSVGGKRIRISAPTVCECKKRIAEWYKNYKDSGDAVARLTPAQLADAQTAFVIMQQKCCRKLLSVIVEEYLKDYGGDVVKTKLLDAYDAYMSKFSDKQEMTRKIVKARVGKFAASHPACTVDSVTTKMVLCFLDENCGGSPKTWNNHMCDLRTFFNWCSKKMNKFCMDNPLQDVEKKPEEYKLPECATPDAVRKLFSHIKNHECRERNMLLFRFTLSCFCGMRTEEIKRQRADDVRLEDGSILVREPKGSQSGRMSYRTFQIPETAKAWLKLVDLKEIKAWDYGDTVMNRAIVEAKKAAGGKYPKNFGRHSFISYHVAAFGDAHKTESIVGTSEEMRKANYQTLATKAEGEAYFAITPDSV